MKTEEQFKSLIEHSSSHMDKCFCLNISNQEATLVGISKNKISLETALVLIKRNQQVYVKGFLNGAYFDYSSFENMIALENLLVGVDCRKTKNNKIYYGTGNTVEKISSSTEMTSDDVVSIFWEYDAIASFTICSFDPTQDEVVREVVSAKHGSMITFLRATALQILHHFQFYINVIEQSSKDDFSRGEHVHDSQSIWTTSQ